MASASDPQKAERPVSNFPPGIAEERLAGTGITFDQMANFQDRLIQTATNGAEAVPPLPVPRIQADSVVLDHQQQKFADAKSKGLASPNLVFDSEPNWSTPAASTPTSKARGLFPSGNERLINTDRNAPTRGSLATSVGQDSPISPRAVMYDVTTSHRPTSPVLHSRTGSLSGLPSLLELNGHRDRESFSLSQAVEQASRLPSQTVFESPPIPEEPSSTHDSQYAVATNAVQDHPFNVGYTSPRLPLADLYQGNSFSPAAVGDSPRHQVQTTLPEDVWDRYGPQQGDMTPDLFDTSMSPNSSYMGADPSRLLDDVAAQTSAATRALKGTDDGVTPTPPFRTKSILRKKSFKKVSKQISSPQLISTTQKLDHATLISPVLEKPTAPTKSPSSARSHVKASPSRGSQMGSIGKSSNYFHRRRSSSFGHEATPDNSFGLGNDGFGDALASQGQGSSDTGPGVHPNHPYMNGGANSGSLSRIFSKINRRKNEQAYGGATIEPFPPELSAAARSSALFSQQPPVRPPQAPVTPELPPLPPVIERSTPWTLPPRMPSSSSSTGHASSLRSPISPTSPVYTLPIDSTLMPRSKSKKKRTPIVLKRDSEVILPGDPGYIPTAIIGRSPEQRALELAEEQSGDSDMLRAVQGAVSPTYSHANVGGRTQLQEQSTDTTLSRSSERMDYSENSNPDILAPLAALNIGDANETKTPRPASPLSLAVSPLKVASAKETVDEALARTMQSSVTPQQTQLDAEVEAATQQPRTQSRPTDPRKSLRDTIVRRTIIIPSGSIDFGDYDRRSLHFSSRKSRRFATSVDEPVPTSANATQSFDVDSPAKVVPAGLPEPDLPAVGLSTFNSAATLTADGSLSNRASGLGGSDYAGSLYDMYISGTPDESGEPESPGSDDAQSLPRRSRVPPPARHIEVTERADGSVVWQVIAGLADRNSVDSVVMRHSQEWSEASGSAKLGSFEREQEAWAPFSSRTAADEDERSFFTRPRAAPKAVAAGMGEDTFDMATPHKQGLRNAVTDAEPSPTRIMYHNDAQLASLLDVLAQGKDSAKFEFHLGPQQVRSPGLNRGSPSTFSGGADSWQGTPIVDANDIESHRSRVEAEIYTLLNRHALDDIQA
uniref:Uncharacterized protein n=2 Tax=Kalmanozyma brasiliensis (strain GHG001) TaxID=1365824 RepID=V5ES29_KALBG